MPSIAPHGEFLVETLNLRDQIFQSTHHFTFKCRFFGLDSLGKETANSAESDLELKILTKQPLQSDQLVDFEVNFVVNFIWGSEKCSDWWRCLFDRDQIETRELRSNVRLNNGLALICEL